VKSKVGYARDLKRRGDCSAVLDEIINFEIDITNK
jgi:hypothetical protein